MEFKHVSVLLNECIENWNIKENGVYVDCTLGGAGHSSEILKRLSKDGIDSILENLDIPKVDGILMDLGVSS